jgi:hypothetical protein
MTATEARLQLFRLAAELHDAQEIGLTANAAYLGDLETEITETRAAYVGLAVTEIATLRAELSGPQGG